MTLQEIEELLDDTRRSPRAGDKITHAMALGVLEIARQLAILNQGRAPSAGSRTKGKSGKKK